MRMHLLTAATLGLLACDSSNGPDDDGPFACIGEIVAAVPTAAQLTLAGLVREHLTNAPVADVKVTICARSDLSCAAPLATSNTAADGTVSFSVPTGNAGFDGFARMEKTGYVRLIIGRPPVAGPQAAPFQSTMVPSAAWAMFLLAAGVTENAQRGHVALRAVDCDGNTAEGVSFTLDRADAGTTARYVNALGLPSAGPTTDASGRGIFLNVPTGAVVATATLAATGQRIGILNFTVQAGFVTGLVFAPT